MSKTPEEALVDSLAQVMTMAELLIDTLGAIAKVYDEMPDGVKRQIAQKQVEQQMAKFKKGVKK